MLELGLDMAQATVSGYMPRGKRPLSQTWRTFLKNHANAVASIGYQAGGNSGRSSRFEFSDTTPSIPQPFVRRAGSGREWVTAFYRSPVHASPLKNAQPERDSPSIRSAALIVYCRSDMPSLHGPCQIRSSSVRGPVSPGGSSRRVR